MKPLKSPRFDSLRYRVAVLLTACIAAACGDDQAARGGAGDTPGGRSHEGGAGQPAAAGATSAGVGGLGAGGSGGGRAGAAGSTDGGAGSANTGGSNASGRGGSGTAGRTGAGGATAGADGLGGSAGQARGGAGGDPGGAPNGGASQGGAPGATLAAVQAIFDDRCVNCHDASKHGVPAYPMLALTAGASHDALVNAPADETCGGTRVVPSNPDGSYLLQKLEQDKPCNGEHMPRAFEVGTATPLTADQLATIRAWILAGAPK